MAFYIDIKSQQGINYAGIGKTGMEVKANLCPQGRIYRFLEPLLNTAHRACFSSQTLTGIEYFTASPPLRFFNKHKSLFSKVGKFVLGVGVGKT